MTLLLAHCTTGEEKIIKCPHPMGFAETIEYLKKVEEARSWRFVESWVEQADACELCGEVPDRLGRCGCDYGYGSLG